MLRLRDFVVRGTPGKRAESFLDGAVDFAIRERQKEPVKSEDYVDHAKSFGTSHLWLNWMVY